MNKVESNTEQQMHMITAPSMSALVGKINERKIQKDSIFLIQKSDPLNSWVCLYYR